MIIFLVGMGFSRYGLRRVPLTDCLRRLLKAGKEKAPLNFRSTGA